MSEVQNESKPSDVDALFERSIVDAGIPPCPELLNRFMDEIKKDEPDYTRLAAIIGADVGISAGLIKTANSPFFGMRQRVRSVNEALTVLGLKAASRAVAGIILRNTFPHIPQLERFWDASARIAHISGWLAQRLEIRGLRAEDAYTYGLFRDCGIPVLLGRFPQYAPILNEANRDTERGFTNVEQTVLPTNHAMIGCILAQSWWLPEEICLAIRNHHDLIALESAGSELPMQSRRLIAVAQLSEHIVQKQLRLSLTEEWAKLGTACLRILELDESDLEQIYIDAAPVVSTEE